MRQFPYPGPSIVVLLAGAVALVASPIVVRRVNDQRADAQIVQASHILAEPAPRIDPPSELPALGDLSPEGARDPLADEASPANGSGRLAAEPRESLLEQINRANRAIARLVEPSVVHVSAMNTMRRRAYVAPYASSGSGWVWSDDGYIVTNAHVVDGAERLQVQFFDGELRDAELVGLDLRTDIAVIKVASGGIHAARRGDSSTLAQGDMVYAFGSPFDFRFSMSAGIVSGLGRSTALDNIDYQNFIQTDAAINPGNSGGPLTDVRGQVIGMNTAIATNPGNSAGQAQFAGIGLAIPMSMIETTVTQLIETGEVRKGFLGVALVDLEAARSGMRLTPDPDEDAAMARAADAYKGEGAVLGRISPGSPAEEAGFRTGDIIVTIDGEKVANDGAVRAIVSSRRPGDRVKFGVWRLGADGESGSRLDLVARLGELDLGANLAPGLADSLRRAGFESFSTATEDRARSLGVPFRRGVMLERIAADSELAETVPPGSVVTGIFNQPIGSIDQLYTRFARATESMGSRRRRGMVDVPLTVTVPDGRVIQIMVPTAY
ncbi:MAG: hypothetical protein RL325_1064 [Planctomycetota bacterium]|jgi:serine protease Do